MTTNRSLRYDAFLSYAHEDEQTVAWLETVLRKAWVPGKRRRRIFRDRTELRAGHLSQELRDALASSRFLIVCCSPAAAASDWINQEIDAFVHSREAGPIHACRSVLACRVGPGGPQHIDRPSALRWVEWELDDQLFLPDLRGDPARGSRAERCRARDESRALLAVLVDLPGKEAVAARVKKRIVALSLAATLAGLAALGLIGMWARWRETAEGRFHSALERVLRATDTEQVVDRALVTTARSLGRLGEVRAFERLAGFIPDRDFRGVTLAAGYASLPSPDCASAERVLQDVDRSVIGIWPEGHLLLWSKCRGPSGSPVLPPSTPEKPSASWIHTLATSGHVGTAKKWLRDGTVTAKERLELAVHIGIAAGLPVEYTADDVRAWFVQHVEAGRVDPHGVLSSALGMLESLHVARRLDDPVARELFRISSRAAGAGDVQFANTWELFAALSAHLAGAARQSEALKLLESAGRNPPHGTGDWTTAWAWRGLAWSRLGNREESQRAFQTAEREGRAERPASRTFREWEAVELAYALADRWPDAFRVAELPGEERARILQRCKLLTLWVARGGGRVALWDAWRPWRPGQKPPAG